jgi:hypothetical protein
MKYAIMKVYEKPITEVDFLNWSCGVPSVLCMIVCDGLPLMGNLETLILVQSVE